MNAYAPRRQSKRWLDGDCPRGVLAIYDDKRETLDRYTIFYATPLAGTTYANMHLQYAGISEYGTGFHGEMPAYGVASFRDRNKNRAVKWTDLPVAVREWVVADLKEG